MGRCLLHTYVDGRGAATFSRFLGADGAGVDSVNLGLKVNLLSGSFLGVAAMAVSGVRTSIISLKMFSISVLGVAEGKDSLGPGGGPWFCSNVLRG
jgi:hypothetical protein